MRVLSNLLYLPFIALVLIGCGASGTPSDESAAADSFTAHGASSSHGSPVQDASRPASEEMAVFGRPRTDADALPTSLSYLRRDHECDPERATCSGTALVDESRLLSASLGVNEQSVYAYPSEQGFGCLTLGGGGGFCIPSFETSGGHVGYFAIDPDSHGEGEPIALVGLRPDQVTGVAVLVGDNRRPATLFSNGFFYELGDGGCSLASIRALIVTFADGQVVERPTEWVAAEGRPCSA